MPEEKQQQSAVDHIQPIRDQMAIDRTILANERTALAYMRTALTMLIVSVAFIKFIDSLIVVIIGVLFIPLAIVVGVAGIRLYRRRRETITRLYGQTPFTPPGVASPEPSPDKSSNTDEDAHEREE